MTYSQILMDFVVIPGLLPTGGRELPRKGTTATIEANPTDHGLEFDIDTAGTVVLIPWSRVQAAIRAPTPAQVPVFSPAARVAQPPPRAKR